MHRIANQLNASLVSSTRYYASSMLTNRQSNPIKDRVMSTPTWPVPYYQRLAKAYPVRQQKSINLSLRDFIADDSNWYNAKIQLNRTLKGRQIVEYTENNIQTKTYLIQRDDCASMTKAYVTDAGQFLDLANRENVRILGGKTLI